MGDVHAPNGPSSNEHWNVLPLSDEVKRALVEMAYVNPTPVQLAVWEPATRGKDAPDVVERAADRVQRDDRMVDQISGFLGGLCTIAIGAGGDELRGLLAKLLETKVAVAGEPSRVADVSWFLPRHALVVSEPRGNGGVELREGIRGG